MTLFIVVFFVALFGAWIVGSIATRYRDHAIIKLKSRHAEVWRELDHLEPILDEKKRLGEFIRRGRIASLDDAGLTADCTRLVHLRRAATAILMIPVAVLVLGAFPLRAVVFLFGGFGGAYYLLHHKYRLSEYHIPSKLPEDLPKHRYVGWNLLWFFLFMGFGLATGVAWGVALTGLGRWNATRFVDAVIGIPATGFMWMFPTMILSVITGAVLAGIVMDRITGEHEEAYKLVINLQHGGDADRQGKVALSLLAVLVVVLIPLFANWYVLFTEDTVVINRFWSLRETSRPYTAVRAIHPFEMGVGRTARTEYVVFFEDGETWTTDWTPTGLDDEKKVRIAEFVSRKSDVPIGGPIDFYAR